MLCDAPAVEPRDADPVCTGLYFSVTGDGTDGRSVGESSQTVWVSVTVSKTTSTSKSSLGMTLGRTEACTASREGSKIENLGNMFVKRQDMG
jgi:hypothetical protein